MRNAAWQTAWRPPSGGASSWARDFFLVNQREETANDARVRLIDAQARIASARAELAAATADRDALQLSR